MTAEVWKSIVKNWFVSGVAVAITWAVAKGLIPATYSAQAATVALAAATAFASAYMAAREKLKTEARAELPQTATPFDIEARMVGIGWGRLLFALKGKSQSDPKVAALSADMITLKLQVERLEAFAEAIQKARAAASVATQ